jgi:hypothetical protein
MSNLRLAMAAVILAVLWLAFVRRSISPAWLVAAIVAFGVLAIAHARVLNRTERSRRARRVYDRGLDRMDGRWIGSGPDGSRFAADHDYALDLDLFGRGSLFQLMDTATTEIGEETLADWLRTPAPIGEAAARQDAVGELAPMFDFREDVAVLAAEAEVGRTGALNDWAASPPVGLSALARVVFAVCSAVTLVLAAAWLAGWLPWAVVVAFILLHQALVAMWRERVARVVGPVARAEHDLALVSAVLARVERQPFAAPKLAAMRSRLLTSGVPPSRRIAELRRLVSWLDSDENLLFKPFAAAVLWKQLFAVAIDRWHGRYGPAVGTWLDAVGELEALCALAAHAAEHPADAFPDLVEDGPILEADGLAHPLLVETAAVRNDVALGAPHPRVLIVSGSNMSGKSTLLRAVGANVVLALAGAPVRAARFRVSVLAIGATLRISDSLHEGHSRFYSEILRIRAIVERAGGRVPVLFLLDEVLHGTNSHDRRIGADAIVRALVARGAIGMVTTHDLALTELASELGAAAANVHFADTIEQGRMVFDYRMRPGVVERSNALELMRAVGLDV